MNTVPKLRAELLDILTAPGTEMPLALEGELLRAPSGEVYTVIDGIPVFVDNEQLVVEKQVLKEFYEDFGWQRPTDGEFYNAQSRYGFDSQTLLSHRRLVNEAQRRHFPSSGRYFLDCASGAIPAKEYLEYSSNYEFHVCVDLTLSALRGARQRLGSRGLYVNADGTRLPFRANAFDAILCSHTLYHVPRDEQRHMLLEFHRVMKPGAKCVVYYNLGEHSLVGRALRPVLALKRWRDRHLVRRKMYSFHHPLSWFAELEGTYTSVDVHVYRVLPNQVFKYLFPTNRVSNSLGDLVIPQIRKLENRQSLAPYAQYVTVVLRK